MNPQDYENLIPEYLANTLSPELRHAFEKELKENSELRKKLSIHEMTQGVVPKQENTISSIEEPVKMEEPTSTGHWWIIGGVLLVAILIAWFFYKS